MQLTAETSSPATGSTLLLAPSGTHVPQTFRDVRMNSAAHARVLAGVQRLRGTTYLADGAVTSSQLTRDGRHVQAADQESWHIVTMSEEGDVTACMRYRTYTSVVSPEGLGVWRSALARTVRWSRRLKSAIETDISLARRTRSHFSEIGGWAVAPQTRGARGALMALWPYALAESLGGGLGVATATARNCSAEILKRIGGRPLEVAGETLPAYFDPEYGCDMEILRFDSRRPAPKYAGQVTRLIQDAMRLPVICADAGVQIAAASAA